MKTVVYRGLLVPLIQKFENLPWRADAEGKTYLFDAKKSDWVALSDGDIVVSSDDGYFVGDESDVEVVKPVEKTVKPDVKAKGWSKD